MPVPVSAGWEYTISSSCRRKAWVMKPKKRCFLLDFGRFFLADGIEGSADGDGSFGEPLGCVFECHDVVSCRCRVDLKEAASLARLDITRAPGLCVDSLSHTM